MKTHTDSSLLIRTQKTNNAFAVATIAIPCILLSGAGFGCGTAVHALAPVPTQVHGRAIISSLDVSRGSLHYRHRPLQLDKSSSSLQRSSNRARSLRSRGTNSKLQAFSVDVDGDGNAIDVGSPPPEVGEVILDSIAVVADDFPGQAIMNSIADHVDEIGSDVVFQDDSIQQLPPPVLESASITQAADTLTSETEPLTSPTPPTSVSPSTSSKGETMQMVKEVSAIALPALGGMLLDPIMSLVDTACVGQVSTTALAAMAPCTSIFQFVFFAFFFLSAATTNLVASNPPEALYDPADESASAKRVDFNERVVSSASLLAVVLGTLATLTMFQFSDPLLRMAGCTNDALLNAARPYLRIRALGTPFVFLATVLQGASLGRGNAWRPLRVFAAAGIINLVGDVYLTLFRGWGAVGAATATVAAQVGAGLFYVIQSRRLDSSVGASSKPMRDVAFKWRGRPTKKMIKTFSTVAATLFSRSVGMMAAYTMLTRTAALAGTTALAAHQVTLQVWWLMSFLPEPMSVAAQTLITRDMKDRSDRVPKLIKTMFGMAGVLGVSAAALTGFILRSPTVASSLVADVSVQKLMASLVPGAVLSMAYFPFATLSDGVCIGLGSFGHLPVIMAGSFVATLAGLATVSRRGWGVVGVWGCMNIFISVRILGHALLSSKLREYFLRSFARKSVDE